MFCIENALHPFICDDSFQNWQFHPFLENFDVGLAFPSIFYLFWFLRVGATSSFLVQFGCKHIFLS
jgi:hypothetical protein